MVSVYYNMFLMINAVTNVNGIFTKVLLSVVDTMPCGRSTKTVRAKNRKFSFLKV